MSSLQTKLANEMFDNNLWWSYSIIEGKENLGLSKGLQNLLGRPVTVLEDIMGEYETELLRLKISEAYQDEDAEKSDFDMRFIASYETLKGKRSFQHQLRIFTLSGEKIIWTTCLDVSEMVALEREMVEAQGRLNLNQLYEKQTALEERNAFITRSYNKQSRFLALLSHELRSPLLGIRSLVKRIRSEMDVSPDVKTLLKTISMTAEQSTYLVNDILTYSQTEYDGITLHPTEVCLPELLENVKQLAKSIASDKDLILSLVYLGEHEKVIVDGVRLTQVLINLIVNAIKFTQYGGVNIEVRELVNNRFVFKITDSGEGISPERQKQIFEPFAQLESDNGKYTSNTQFLGAGLGLFVVKQLVELMGGKIKVTSQKGVGTTFEFDLKIKCVDSPSRSLSSKTDETQMTELIKLNKSKTRSEDLPLKNKKDVSKYKADENQESPKLDQCRVLVADDSKINRMVLAGYLADLTCNVVEVRDGREAWKVFQEQDFDYVLLDIQMPYLDGVEVSKKIKQHYDEGKSKQLKGVFAITAGGDSSGFISEHEKPESVGFDAWLVKPVNKKQIVELLEQDYRPLEKHSNLKSLVSDHTKPLINEISSEIGNESTEEVSQEIETQQKLALISDVPKQFHQLIEPFIVEMNDGLKELEQFNVLNNREAIKKKAHYLKGNCMLFQLPGLVDLFRHLEVLQQEDKLFRFEKTQKTLQNVALNVKSLENSVLIGHNKQI
ncbi:ATP-binding protein [Thiomicrorhabdus sp. Milos-T2]|uniref:hybrid sensor histidine kinase/response regulator n=1 Tax=Thiomicrorhabdus sp. Milos-T2 TaxID=90814 RepID=UPI000494DA35|nr:ATP-binding protein [Thiomicrorhabdus sp. Milos-T2]